MKAFDEDTRRDHPYLVAQDQCWWLTEYSAGGGGHGAGATSRLIVSLKALPSSLAFNPARARSKRRAALAIAGLLRGALARSWVEEATWIPIPPARALSDVDHDNRLLPVLRTAFAGYDADIRTVLYQRESNIPDHLRRRRLSAQRLYESLDINWYVVAGRPLRPRLMLFDDVLTTGKHYRCCERRLRAALPGVRVAGLFVARRALAGKACRPP